MFIFVLFWETLGNTGQKEGYKLAKRLSDIDIKKLNGEQLLEVVTFINTALKKVNEEQAIINKDKERHSMAYNPDMDDQIRKGMGGVVMDPSMKQRWIHNPDLQKNRGMFKGGTRLDIEKLKTALTSEISSSMTDHQNRKRILNEISIVITTINTHVDSKNHKALGISSKDIKSLNVALKEVGELLETAKGAYAIKAASSGIPEPVEITPNPKKALEGVGIYYDSDLKNALTGMSLKLELLDRNESTVTFSETRCCSCR